MTPSADSSQIGPSSDSTWVIPGPEYGRGTDAVTDPACSVGPDLLVRRANMVIPLSCPKACRSDAPERSDAGGVGKPIVDHGGVAPPERSPAHVVDGHRIGHPAK